MYEVIDVSGGKHNMLAHCDLKCFANETARSHRYGLGLSVGCVSYSRRSRQNNSINGDGRRIALEQDGGNRKVD